MRHHKVRHISWSLVLSILLVMPTKIFGEDRVPAENIEEFVEVYKRIKEQYVDVVDDEKLFDMAIQGMVSGLDPHSSFLSQDEFNELKIGTTGKFGGLGIEITTEDSFVKVIVEEKRDYTQFENFVDQLYRTGVHDVKIVETLVDTEAVDDVDLSVKDTLDT